VAISREILMKTVTEALADALAEKSKPMPASVGPETGSLDGLLLDSLGLVTMVMELGPGSRRHGVTVVLASERPCPSFETLSDLGRAGRPIKQS
jgi:hypothetical protein